MHFPKVNPSYGLISKPILADKASQCLSFIPSVLKATTIGTYGLNSSTEFLMPSAIFKISGSSLSLKALIT